MHVSLGISTRIGDLLQARSTVVTRHQDLDVVCNEEGYGGRVKYEDDDWGPVLFLSEDKEIFVKPRPKEDWDPVSFVRSSLAGLDPVLFPRVARGVEGEKKRRRRGGGCWSGKLSAESGQGTPMEWDRDVGVNLGGHVSACSGDQLRLSIDIM
ncbi:hypothetical protein CBR_g57884 [Chara braunii]|uniref:Uncharacterized protein n=1 Tax=Chara braunii TaxID=69332 RepID=A0A388K8A3_CHABU|nr:hypothetical protein CBR_g57884 [Chara braunii]|eukprot:GBG66285.1 hypothetical protein CBR_g57884 [Chara braunii]